MNSRRDTYSVRPTSNRVLCVFVPGLKGSVLKCTSCDRRTWPPAFLDSNIETVRRFVRTRSRKIEHLMNADEYDCLVTHSQTVCGIVKKVTVLSGIYTRDVYATFLRNLQDECDGAGLTDDGLHKVVTLHSFAYDWTLGIRNAAEELFAYLHGASAYSAVVLIAHSMGGLVCRYVLEEMCYKGGADPLYRKVRLVYAMGVPHYGTVRALHYLIDPRGGVFTDRCRHIQSLYDMIPFSDLNAQIDGIQTTNARRPCWPDSPLTRYRSELFLKRTDREIIVDRDDWQPRREYVTAVENSAEALSNYTRCLIEKLTTRFPVLAPYTDRLREAASVHFALDSQRRPTGCVYMFVNAVGYMSPSLIDKNDVMFRKCARGDGLVCSTVDEKRRSDRSAVPLVCPPTTVNSPKSEKDADATIRGFVDNKYSVHVDMLKHIDVFRVVREVLAREIFGNTTIGRMDGIKYLWRRTIRENVGSTVVSSSTVPFRRWSITAANLASGRCVLSVSVRDALDIDTPPVDGDVTLDMRRLPVGSSCQDRKPKSEPPSLDDGGITSVTLKLARDWNRVTLIVGGHYTISNVRS